MEEEGEVFLGHSVAQNKHISDETAHIIDEEVRVIVDRNYDRALKILTDKRDILEKMAAALIKYETIDSNQVDDLMAGKEPRPPSDWIDSDDESNTPTDSGAKVSGKDKKSGGDSTIGGPAGEH